MEARLTYKPDHHTALFWQRVVANLTYWHQYVSTHCQNPAVLQQEYTQIINALDYALELKATWPKVLQLLELLISFMERSGRWEVWRRLLNRAVYRARQIQDNQSAVRLLVMLARLSQRQGDFPKVVSNYRQVIHLAGRIGDLENKARACSNLSFMYTELGYWWRAEILGCYALAVFNDLAHAHGVAHTESHLGSLATRRGRWELARQHFERACTLWQEMEDHHSLMRGLTNLGGLFCDMKQSDKALPPLHQALDLAKLTGEEAEIGLIYINLGAAYRFMGDTATAASYAWQAEHIFRRFDNFVGQAMVQDNLGLGYLDEQKWPEAASYLETGLKMWRQLENRWGEVRNLTYWVEYELAQENYSQAAKRITGVEQRLDEYGLKYQGPYWQSLLDKCRNGLTDNKKTSEALETSEVSTTTT